MNAVVATKSVEDMDEKVPVKLLITLVERSVVLINVAFKIDADRKFVNMEFAFRFTVDTVESCARFAKNLSVEKENVDTFEKTPTFPVNNPVDKVENNPKEALRNPVEIDDALIINAFTISAVMLPVEMDEKNPIFAVKFMVERLEAKIFPTYKFVVERVLTTPLCPVKLIAVRLLRVKKVVERDVAVSVEKIPTFAVNAF